MHPRSTVLALTWTHHSYGSHLRKGKPPKQGGNAIFCECCHFRKYASSVTRAAELLCSQPQRTEESFAWWQMNNDFSSLVVRQEGMNASHGWLTPSPTTAGVCVFMGEARWGIRAGVRHESSFRGFHTSLEHKPIIHRSQFPLELLGCTVKPV